MNLGTFLIILFACFIVFAVLHTISKSKKPFKRAMLSMILGFAVLLAVVLTGGLTGLKLPFSMLSILVSVVGGVPGVVLLVLLQFVFI
ncbi:MAG: pro-sigmaK processing inhibitor BofA family protein [Oscillospiraceae bacterium]|nr:pro-sigmaK processing inhibitor BofA family protein [Oscillospiraceae bacterium]